MTSLVAALQTSYLTVADHVTWMSLATYATIAAVTWLVYKAFCEPFVSPLRKVPGMKFNPFFGNMREIMKGEAMEATIKMIHEYGTICRYYFMFGRERLMVADPDIMKHILVTNSKNYRKPPGRIKLLRMVLGEGLIMLEGQTHAAHKRLMSPSFNNHSVRQMVPVMIERSQRLADHWLRLVAKGDGSTNQGVDIPVQEEVQRTTLDIIGQLGFGYEFNSLENPDLPVNKAFQGILTGAGLSWRMAIPYYYTLPMPDVRAFKADCAMMNETVKEVIRNKRRVIDSGVKDDAVTRDVLGQMLLARDEEGNGLSDGELQAEVMTLMLAGHETTAVSVSWLLLLLAQHPDVQTKVRDEVVRVLPRQPEHITWEHLDQLKYCGAVVKETLRLLPPVPITLRESLAPDYLQAKGGPRYYVPAGTISMLSMGPMMRRPDLFPDPDIFRPERFLDPSSGADQALYNFLPFLIGSRMCIGYRFALLETKALLAMLVRELEFEVIPGTRYKRQSRITMRPSPSLKLRVRNV